MPRANRDFLPGYVWHITQRQLGAPARYREVIGIGDIRCLREPAVSYNTAFDT